jgi:hypothetical protein
MACASSTIDKGFTDRIRSRISRFIHFPRSPFYFGPRRHEQQGYAKEYESQQDASQTANDRIRRVQRQATSSIL